MPSIFEQLGALISSIFHAFEAALGSVIAVFQSILTTIFNLIGTMFAMVGTAIKGLAETFEGLIKFFLSNIVVIGALVGAFFLYTAYQKRSGRSITAKPAPPRKN
ncbi:hypothetical protein BP5796_04084 [Coleophoma crateriformis]|uniref:Uncharacterized protein n=1 Tax=Coleophoma crateriformis TaxID=565419 RepID=A0A3D8SHD5_9HELO|nr:hypothetical protein BP5796_04084 [Coleophoma crateriformis]